MNGIITFKRHYLVFTLIIFFIEILIALFVHDSIIRPYVGDVLAAILVYCFLRSFLNISVKKLAFSALAFSYLIETLQYFNVLEKLGLQGSTLAKTLLGSSFEWTDIVAYTLGIAIVLYIEKVVAKKSIH